MPWFSRKSAPGQVTSSIKHTGINPATTNRYGHALYLFSVVVHGLKVVAFMLGPVFLLVMAFMLIGYLLGFFGSITISHGWISVVATLLFFVFYALGRHLDRRLEALESRSLKE